MSASELEMSSVRYPYRERIFHVEKKAPGQWVVLDELQALKAAGKPLVVSMGTLAASGGYYISMPADEIWANESTITGSIGVGALVPTVDRGLGALGIHVDGIGTTKLSGQLRLDRPLGEEARELLQETVQDAYRIFVNKVAEARNFTEVPDARDTVGHGTHVASTIAGTGAASGGIRASNRLRASRRTRAR